MATLAIPSEPLLIAGLRPRDPALETFPVRPGGATAVQLHGDDLVRVIDRHGGQVAELTAVGAPLGPPPDADATFLRGLTRDGSGSDDVGGRLAGLGIDLADARCVRLFGPDSEPGSAVELAAAGETTLVVAAPGGRLIDGETPATELRIEVRRALPRAEDDGQRLPAARSARQVL